MLEAALLTLRLSDLSHHRHGAGHHGCAGVGAYGRFKGRTLFLRMVYAPIVMPEVITGLSFILLFVAVGLDRGFWTLLIAHITFTMCFVTVTVQARILSFDRSEEAAMDLGCPPFKTFFLITLPLIWPRSSRLASGLHAVDR